MGKFRFASLFAATAMLLGLGFAGQATSAGVNLSKNSGVATYLRSHGWDPGQFAIQRGIRNYAGPHCPGAGWNCTVTLKVVQVASVSNVYECLPGDTCTGVLQGSATGTANNTFICEQGGSSDQDQSGDQGQQDQSGDQGQQPAPVSSPTRTQTCGVTQLNGSGNNVVRIKQMIKQGNGTALSAEQTADVTQTSVSGSNHASVLQAVMQSIKEDAASQAQTAFQEATFNQTSTSGRNRIDLTQGLKQTEKTDLATVSTQDQGGSARGNIHQLSTGVSTFDVDQHARQKMDGTAATVQNQDPYEFCCASQGTNIKDSGAISQESVQDEFPNHNQQGTLEADCTTTGKCNAMQSATQNGVTLTNGASSRSFHIYDICLNTVCTTALPD
jgi:hypothetical protein